ncbi:hypothetical protein ACT7C8_20870 [Bacillus cereus]
MPLFFLGYKLVDIFKQPFYVVRERIITSKILTDEDYAETVTQEFFNSIINPLQDSMNKTLFVLKSICDYVIFSPYMSFILLLCIALVLSIKSKPLLNRFIVSVKNKKIYCIISQNYIHHLIEEYLTMRFWNLKLNYWKEKGF